MSTTINFDDGLRSYDLNGDSSRIIMFNPTDFAIATRFDIAIKEIEKYKAKNILADGDIINETSVAVSDLDTFIKKQIDFILGNPVSDVVFGNVSPMSPVGGVPLYERFLDAVSPIITAEIEKENKEVSKRISKYTSAVKGLK